MQSQGNHENILNEHVPKSINRGPNSSCKKRMVNDDLMSMWASSFGIRKDSIGDSDMNARKTVQTFVKPKTTLEIDPEYQQNMIMKA